ncbi:aldo/keto reductase [Pseudanabaena sp. FACHB-2040]|uniref:aldo/keto reductase n=1 Tax=Pseudanabaena sp. FACHB-2040 TaxID=2692859 RepID=UPI001686136D|nr:aldo/keto reductase [Pseudanabaena sp. FACHB-2040]MBD2259017.1 aldo/keto reductase [Pseudanabaena sp. FACHB-2040]
MQYRRFGKTNLSLSVFSLGTMRSLASLETFQDTVSSALEKGINHLETARGYGDSERRLGEALKQLGCDRSKLVITTKISPTPDAETMAQQISESLERLQLDYLDCLAVHGINTWEHLDWVKAPKGCMAAVRAAVAAGQIRHVGFSTHGFREVIEATIHTNLFEFVNLHYYYFFQRHAAVIDLAETKDMGVFIISPADKGGLLYTPPAQLHSLCHPCEPLHLTYRWLLSDPRVTTLSVGPASPEELDWPLSNVDDSPLTPSETAALERLEQHLQTTLGSDRCSQCYQCLPCPEEIHIPEVLRLRNLAVAYDMSTFGQYRYRMFENAGHWFPGTKANRCTDCGDCLPRCPEQLDIPSLLRDTHDRLKGPDRKRLWG